MNIMADPMAAIRKRAYRKDRTHNVLTLHFGRAGSTVLGRLLNQHPAIDWAGERLAGMRKARDGTERNPKFALDSYLPRIERRMWRKRAAVFGMEFKPAQCCRTQYEKADLERFVRDMSGLGMNAFLVLERRNKLRVIVSKLSRRANFVRHASSSPTEPTRVHLPVLEVGMAGGIRPHLETFEFMDLVVRNAEQVARDSGVNVVRLCYEDDILTDPRAGYRKLLAMFGLPLVEVEVDLSRTNPFPLSDLLENYDEVADVLSGTRFQWMLDE